MNGKKAKAIRRQAKENMVAWLQSILPEEEQDKINVKNVFEHAPKQTHVMALGQRKSSIYSFKWFVKKVKQGEDWEDAIQ